MTARPFRQPLAQQPGVSLRWAPPPTNVWSSSGLVATPYHRDVPARVAERQTQRA